MTDLATALVDDAIRQTNKVELLSWQKDAVGDLLDRLHHAQANDYPFRHLYNVATGAGKTEIGGVFMLEAHKRFWDSPTIHPTHAWACDRQLLYNETIVRLGERIAASDVALRISASAHLPASQRILLPDHINMVRPQSFVKRGKEHKSHNRPINYSHDLITYAKAVYPWGLMIRDEAHHDASDYGCSTAYAWGGPLLGLTGTAWRGSDYDCLGAGLGGPEAMEGPYLTITYGPHPRELVGSLLSELHIVDIDPRIMVDPSNLKLAVGNTDGYDLRTVEQEIGRLLSIGHLIVQEWERLKIPCLGFCPTKNSAHQVAALFQDHGYKAGVVTDETPEPERRALLDALHDGKMDFLASVDVFGEGVNVPNVRCIAMLRPTASLARHRQFLGRGLRKRSDNSPLILFDFANNIYVNGSPLDGYEQMGLQPRAYRKGRKCSECGTRVYSGSICPTCGADVPNPKIPTTCPDCGEWVNWNQKSCVCGAAISWECRDATVVLSSGHTLQVSGHHRRHFHTRFQTHEYCCDEAIAVAVAEYNRQLEAEQAEKRKVAAEKRRQELEQAARVAEELERKSRARIEEQLVEQKARERTTHGSEIASRGPNWQWVWHKKESPHLATLELKIDNVTHLAMVDRRSSQLLVMNQETYGVDPIGHIQIDTSGYIDYTDITRTCAKLLHEWANGKAVAKPDKYLDDNLKEGFDVYET